MLRRLSSGGFSRRKSRASAAESTAPPQSITDEVDNEVAGVVASTAAPPVESTPPPSAVEALAAQASISTGSSLTLQATASLPQGYTFLRLTVNLDGGRLGIGLDDEYCVTQLKPGGPGELAGLLVDDQLVEVNGISVFGTDSSIASLMPKDSAQLVLGLRRPPGVSTISVAASDFNDEFLEPNEVLLRTSASQPLGINVDFSPKGRGLPEVAGLDAGGAAQAGVRSGR